MPRLAQHFLKLFSNINRPNRRQHGCLMMTFDCAIIGMVRIEVSVGKLHFYSPGPGQSPYRPGFFYERFSPTRYRLAPGHPLADAAAPLISIVRSEPGMRRRSPFLGPDLPLPQKNLPFYRLTNV